MLWVECEVLGRWKWWTRANFESNFDRDGRLRTEWEGDCDGATNRQMFDPRFFAGRFDRRVILTCRPQDREILKIHSRKAFAEDVNLAVIAERTPGFGADLYSLITKGYPNHFKKIETKFPNLIWFVLYESDVRRERRSHLSKKERSSRRIMRLGTQSSPPFCLCWSVHKISIISRGRAAGYVLKLLEDINFNRRKNSLQILLFPQDMSQKLLFNDWPLVHQTFASFPALARDMVTKYGMSDLLSPIALENQANANLRFSIGSKEYSEKVSEIDAEVSKIMKRGSKIALETITTHRKALMP